MKKLLSASIAALLSLSVAGYASAQQVNPDAERAPAHEQKHDGSNKSAQKYGNHSGHKKGSKHEGKNIEKKDKKHTNHKKSSKHEGKKDGKHLEKKESDIK